MHTIRLREPWQQETLVDGVVRWSRCFNWPTRLLPNETLWLIVSPLPGGTDVWLNGQPLGSAPQQPAGRFDTTSLATDRNLLVIHLPGTSGDDTFPLDVRLEIDEG